MKTALAVRHVHFEDLGLAAAARSRLEQWYIGHAGEIAATPGIDVAELRRQAPFMPLAWRRRLGRFSPPGWLI